MGQRSPYNDRYKTDQKGKTRRSASSAKPKRDIADLTPASSAKKTEKKKGWFGGATAPVRAVGPVIENSPKMKQLRRLWWVLWVTALAVALVLLVLQRGGAAYAGYLPIGWGVWLVAMGGAFYLEFVPIRKERTVMLEAAAAKSNKGSKAEKAAARAEKSATAATPPGPDDRQPPSPEDPA
jgi:hypothetical protein